TLSTKTRGRSNRSWKRPSASFAHSPESPGDEHAPEHDERGAGQPARAGTLAEPDPEELSEDDRRVPQREDRARPSASERHEEDEKRRGAHEAGDERHRGSRAQKADQARPAVPSE